jgi:hypothetical protein
MLRLIAGMLLALLAATQVQATCTTGALPFNLQNNTVADATQVMANFGQISTGVAANCAASGANTDITSLGGLTTPLSTGSGGTWVWVGGTSTGTANAQVVATVTPATGFSLTQGKTIVFKAGFTNTGATTLNIFGTGAVNLFHINFGGIAALQGGEVQSGGTYSAIYDGTQYVLQNLPEGLPIGAQTTIAGANTVDLGTINSHNAQITGSGNTINSFGSSASTGQSLFLVCFASGPNTLTQNATSMILPGAATITTAANDCLFAMYLGSGNWQVVNYQRASGAPVSLAPVPGLMFGCTLSGGGSQIITIAACTSTSDDQLNTMVVGTTFTKTFSNWAVGTGNGGLDTGSVAINTYYFVYEIMRTDTGVVDYLLSTSATAPTFPANYTKKRRLGTIKTDATPNIISFSQNGDEFYWSTPLLDVNTTVGTTPTLFTLNTPPQIKTNALLRVTGGSASVGALVLFNSPDETSTNANVPGGNFTTATAVSNAGMPATINIRTNTSQQIRAAGTVAGMSITVVTYGWIDTRGRI